MAHDCEPTGCFRTNQRNRRVRAAPQDPPYIENTASTTTTTTTATTSTTEIPSELLSYVSLPDLVNYCPASEPFKPVMYFDAFGGDNIYESNGYKIHEFDNSGIFYIQPYDDSTFQDVQIDFLIVGGGGGGGNFDGGGGGGAGHVKKSSFRFKRGIYEVEIGAGGSIGRNGGNTIIKTLGIKSIGGGAGGDSLTKNAGIGANGGGAGSKSDSDGGVGILGYNGGSSTGNSSGAGGGGAGENGGNTSSDSPHSGKGGAGVPITMDGRGTYAYYGGGGAGDPTDSTSIAAAQGGGGSTISKNGTDGLGGGGAGSGGGGGSGKCIFSYMPITTPPPTTTTLPPPAVPGPVVDFSLEGLYQSVKAKWLSPLAVVGATTITAYEVQVMLGSQTVYQQQILLENLQTEDIHYAVTISDLNDLEGYTCKVSAINSVGQGEISSLTVSTITTTPVTTTTIPPSNSVVGIDIDGDITNGYLEISSLSLNAPPGSERNFTSSIKASGDYVFYDEPVISIFGDILPHIRADSITHSVSSDNTRVTSLLPVVVPDNAQTLGSIFVVAQAVQTTTTTTTTSTTILPELCTSLYNDADFDIIEQAIVDGETSIDNFIPSPNSDSLELIYIPPSGDELALRPLQAFVSETTFPTSIIGTILENSIVPGYPWYNSSYYEIARTEDDSEIYIQGLSENYNLSLFQGKDANGNDILYDNMFYMLRYPPVDNNEILEIYSENIYFNPDNLHTINMTVKLDYICSITNPNVYGSGSESVDGFLTLTIIETRLDSVYNLVSKQVSTRDMRMSGNFNSVISGKTYYYMLDYGTRQKILGT